MRTLPIRVVFTPTREAAVRGYWETVGRPWSLVAVPLTLLGTAGMVWVLIASGIPPAVALLQASPLPIVVFTVAAFLFGLAPRKAFDRLPASWRRTEREILFGEERIDYRPPVPGAPAEWPEWRWFVETRNFFALYPKANLPGDPAMLIPKAAFVNAQDLEDFRELVTRKVAARAKRPRG